MAKAIAKKAVATKAPKKVAASAPGKGRPKGATIANGAKAPVRKK